MMTKPANFLLESNGRDGIHTLFVSILIKGIEADVMCFLHYCRAPVGEDEAAQIQVSSCQQTQFVF